MIAAIRKRLRPVKRIARSVRRGLAELPYRLMSPPPGSANWLIKKEIAFGGYVENVPRKTVSPVDPRSPEEINSFGMMGGDRMLHHGYAPTYANALRPFLDQRGLTLCEFGILKGSGLALWCELFPDCDVIGCDIDLQHFRDNEPNLRRNGAFATNQPELHLFDQLADGAERMSKILQGRKLDIVIDDGLHSLDSIIGTWRAIKPHLASRSVFIVEDFENLLDYCGSEFAGFDVCGSGKITIVSQGIALPSS